MPGEGSKKEAKKFKKTVMIEGAKGFLTEDSIQ